MNDLILRRSAGQDDPALSEAPDGRICVVINDLEDSFPFGDDTVPGLSALEYVRYEGQWYSKRKMQSCLDLGLGDMMQKYYDHEHDLEMLKHFKKKSLKSLKEVISGLEEEGEDKHDTTPDF